MSNRPDADIFCEECDVSLDLHSGEDSCDLAARKADLMSTFWGAFR